MKISANITSPVVDPKPTRSKYPEARIINEKINTFEHVANGLMRQSKMILP
tara:strand:+ start:1012 stop:1164 length:153 start_codon:yes stop_codon:yes gene_type:complete